MKNIAFLSLLCLLLFSCRKDSDTDLTTTKDYVPPIIEINVNASIEGIILEESGAPVDQAMVRIGNQTTTTNREGLFVIRDIIMNQSGTLLSVEKEGFFDGSMRFFPKEDSKNFATLTLLEKQIIGTIDPATGGELSSSEGILLNFPPNSVVDANNQTYTGTVSVAARWLNPEAENLFEIMPGNLQGVNQEGDEVALISFGMMAVELLDDSGNELQLGNGQKATLSFPLSGDYLSKAPAEIPLWHFDENSGLWEEEGKAILQGNYYVGDVAHFSFWNCDDPYPLIRLSGRVLANTVSGDTLPLANALVRISTSNLVSGFGYTDKNGYFTGKVPAGESLDLIIKNQSANCNKIVYSTNLDPIDTDTDLGDIWVDIPTDDIIEISGSLFDCNSAPLTDGWVKIILDGEISFHYVYANTFNISIYNCNDATELEIAGLDFNSLEQSSSITLNIENQISAGTIEVCGTVLTDILRFTLDGNEVFLPSQIYKINDNKFEIHPLNSFRGVFFTLDATAGPILPGNYDKNDISYFRLRNTTIPLGSDTLVTSSGCGLTSLDCINFTEITLTEYTNEIGEYAKGRFNGTIDVFSSNGNGTPLTNHSDLPFSCEFSLLLTER